MNTEATKLARQIAEQAHFGQTDRGGAPYICHPLHLAEQFQDEILVTVALLHDVVEDSDVTMDDLKET